MKLAKLIQAYRKAHNLSVRALADEIGIHYVSLSRFERGVQRGITYKNFMKIVLWSLSA